MRINVSIWNTAIGHKKTKKKKVQKKMKSTMTFLFNSS